MLFADGKTPGSEQPGGKGSSRPPGAVRSLDIELLEELTQPGTVHGVERLAPEDCFLCQHRRVPSYFDQFWTSGHQHKLLRLIAACGTFTINYLYDAFHGEFADQAAGLLASLPKRRRARLSAEELGKTYYYELTEFLCAQAGDAIRLGQADMLIRGRRCVMSGETFDDSEFGASISFYRRRIREVEVLRYQMDLRTSRHGSFQRIGDPEDVLATLEDYGRLIDALGFFPMERASEIDLLANLERSRFQEVLPLMERCFYPSRYAQALGGHIPALFATGRLGTTPIVRGSIGYRALAEDGHVCNSLAEKVIDDWMYRKGIPHEKEPVYPGSVRAIVGGRVRADWRVGDTYVEYFGLQSSPDYARKTAAKLDACAQTGVRVLALYPGDEFRLAEVFRAWVA